jgi:Ca2+-binding RTX toxin-like protein
VAAVLLAGLAVAEPAEAVRVEVTPDAVVYTAAPGEINRVGIGRGRDAGQIQVLDSSDIFPGATSARVDAVEPCRLASASPPTARAAVLHGAPVAVDCPARPSIVVLLGDNGDSMAIDIELATSDRVDAGPGADSASAGGGADVLLGGPGNDTLVGGLGPDRVDGGTGEDTARYDADVRRGGVVARIGGAADDGSAEDGPAGARDALVGVEGVQGTSFADVLTGDARANTLLGGEGADRLSGAGGPDALSGGPGRDRLAGGRGGDRLESRDGVLDRVACDAGDDVLSVDLRDRAGEDCETVGRAGPDIFESPMEIAPRARLSRAGRLLVRVACPSGSACDGTVALLAPGGRRVGRAPFDAAVGKTATVAVPVGRGARRARSHRVEATNGEGPFAQRTTRRVTVSGAAPARKGA